MEPGEDLVIRLSSAVTLRSALDDFEFNAEQFLPYLERSFSLLFTLLKETEECETKVCKVVQMSWYHCFRQFFSPTDECVKRDVASHRITWEPNEAFSRYIATASSCSVGCFRRAQSVTMCNY